MLGSRDFGVLWATSVPAPRPNVLLDPIGVSGGGHLWGPCKSRAYLGNWWPVAHRFKIDNRSATMKVTACSLPDGSARGSRRKQLVSERPSGSFTSVGFPKEANLFRFFRLPSESFTSSGVAAFWKTLHLWRGTCVLPKEGKKLNLFLRLSERSLTSGGFLRKASPLAGWRLPSWCALR